MKRFIEAADRSQSTLLPECLDDWVDESNPVRVVDGNLIKWDWFPTYDKPPFKEIDDRIIVSWDNRIEREGALD